MKENRLWLLISLQISGEATAEELEELATYTKEDLELVKKLELLQQICKPSVVVAVDEAEHANQAENAFEKHLKRLNNEIIDHSLTVAENNITEDSFPVPRQTGKKFYRYWWVGVAASVLAFWFFSGKNDKTSPQSVKNIVSTKAGYKASINLPDGSKVWLNGDSKITYDGDFKGETREVYLSGEAFFDVAKDKARPFIIHTRTINLKVLGTAFNVRSYDYAKETETSLVHGSVEITLTNNPDKKIVLKPGEKLLVKNSPDTIVHKTTEHNDDDEPIAVLAKMHYYGKDSSAVETSWTKNNLVFNNERLDRIALNLERWFNVKVIVKDESLKKGKYTATIEEEDKLEDVLEALKTTEGFFYSIKDKEVIISRAKF